jgi:hypothetical protein
VKAITEYPRPKNVKELRRLLGLFNWFRKFIPNYSALVNPLTRLLKKGQLFHWRNEQDCGNPESGVSPFPVCIMINLLALSASRSCVEALFRQTSLCNLYFLLLIITSLNTTCLKIREGSRHTFYFRVEIITNLTILFVSLYFKVPQRYETPTQRVGLKEFYFSNLSNKPHI